MIPLLLAITALTPQSASEAFPKSSVPYSAHFVINVDEHILEGTLYHSEGQDRLDYTLAGKSFLLFLNKEDHVAWLLLPPAPLRFRIPLKDSSLHPNLLRAGVIQKKTPLGSRSIGGILSKGFSITFTHTSGARYEGSIWLSTQDILTAIDLKRHSESPPSPTVPSHFSLALSKLSLKPLPPQVFEVPETLNTLDVGELLTLSPPGPTTSAAKAPFAAPSP